MKVQKGYRFFELGAWVLVIAGFCHAFAAIPDIFLLGLFSPTAEDALLPLRKVPLNIVEIAHGNGTSLFGSAWGAYIGFAISIVLLLGFLGLIFLIIVRYDHELIVRIKSIFPVSIAVSAISVTISLLFLFYLPTLLIAFSLICVILAWFNLNKGKYPIA